MCDFEDLDFTSEFWKVFSLLCRVNLKLNLGQTLPLHRFTCKCQIIQSFKCVHTKTHFIYLYIYMYRRVCWEYRDLDELHHCDIITTYGSSMQNEMSQTEPRAASELINCSLRNGCICSDYGWPTALCPMSLPLAKCNQRARPKNGHVTQSQQIWGVLHLTCCQVASGSVRHYQKIYCNCSTMYIFFCILCTGHRSGSPKCDPRSMMCSTQRPNAMPSWLY